MKVLARGQVGRVRGPLLRDRNASLYANPEKWDGEAAGSVRAERMYYCTDHQGSVVALVGPGGALVEQARYSANGVPFGLPLGDVDADGDCDGADDTLQKAIEATGVYDVRGDLDLDGDVDSADWAIVTAGAGEVLGWGALSVVQTRSSVGFGSLDHDAALDFIFGYTAYRAAISQALSSPALFAAQPIPVPRNNPWNPRLVHPPAEPSQPISVPNRTEPQPASRPIYPAHNPYIEHLPDYLRDRLRPNYNPDWVEVPTIGRPGDRLRYVVPRNPSRRPSTEPPGIDLSRPPEPHHWIWPEHELGPIPSHLTMPEPDVFRLRSARCDEGVLEYLNALRRFHCMLIVNPASLCSGKPSEEDCEWPPRIQKCITWREQENEYAFRCPELFPGRDDETSREQYRRHRQAYDENSPLHQALQRCRRNCNQYWRDMEKRR